MLDADEVSQGRPVGVTRMGERLVFWQGSDGQLT
jgi:phenylpropionate dioxygenase-like ring-hydroxylating dioxygenase large terminal subunit